MEHCQLCYASLTSLFPGRTQTVCDGSKLQEIMSKCNKYLSKDVCPNTNWDLSFYATQFCEECGENTQQLVQLDLKLEHVNTEIKQLIDRITIKILNERHKYQLLNSQISKSSSIPQTAVHILNEGQSQSQGQVEGIVTKPVLEDTFGGWAVPSSNDSVYGSIQDGETTISPDPGGNVDNNISEKINTPSKKRKKANNSPRNQGSSKSNLDVSKVTSSDLQQLKSGDDGFACPVCSKKFTRLDILKRHDCDRTTYECETCGKSFSSQGSLQIHNRTHTGEKPHKCETCGKGFSLPHHLRLHLLTHTAEKPFQCDICKKSFREKNYLAKHKVQHSSSEAERRKYSCEICSKTFTLYPTLKQHMKAIHSFDSRYKCKFCEKDCGTSHTLRLHESTHTKEKKFKCAHCYKTFRSSDGVKNHELTHTAGGKHFQCDACGKSFYSVRSLKTHMRFKHVQEGDVQEYVCDICGKVCKTQLQFSQHRRQHVKKPEKTLEPFKCVVCDRSYSREDYLVKHQKVVHVVTTLANIVCDRCGKDFDSNIEFHNHKRTHTTSSDWCRYKCEICEETFRSRCDKICHFNKNHTESEFPFKCVSCERAFVGRKDLNFHKRNECTVKRTTTQIRKFGPRKRSKKMRKRIDSDNDEKEHSETKLDVSSSNLRRSGRVRNRNVNKEEPQESQESSDGDGYDDDGEHSECERSECEGEKPVEIKAENDIWVKEEPADFSD